MAAEPEYVPLQTSVAKIGNLGEGGAGLSSGHADGHTISSLFEIVMAMRKELDQLYYKLANHPEVGGSFGCDDGTSSPSTPHQRLFVP